MTQSKVFLEYEGELCCIPTGNACFGKCLEHIYTKYFLNEYEEFILRSNRCKNIMYSAKIQPFCRKYNLNVGIYNQILLCLSKTITERRICLFIHNIHFCVLWEENQPTFPQAIDAIEKIFRYEETQINDNVLKQVVEYKFPTSYEMNC